MALRVGVVLEVRARAGSVDRGEVSLGKAADVALRVAVVSEVRARADRAGPLPAVFPIC